MNSKLKEKLGRIAQEIASEMKALGVWSAKRDDSHPQISTPSDWIQWDYLPAAQEAIEKDILSEAYGNIKIHDYIGQEFVEPKFDRFRFLLKEWDETFGIYAAPIIEKIPKLYDRVAITWEVPVAAVNDAFELKFEEIRKAVKLPGYKTGAVPMDLIREKYLTHVRDLIAGPFILAQMKAGMVANGYDFDRHYPREESDISLLRPNSPFSMRLEFSVAVSRSEDEILEEIAGLDLTHRQARLSELLEMAEAGKMTKAVAAIKLLKAK